MDTTGAKYITFNYSNTLEKYYNVAPSHIYYIHNKAKERHSNDSSIMIGHNVKVGHNYRYENIDPALIALCDKATFEYAKRYYVDSFKDTEINLKGVSKLFPCDAKYNEIIIIIGHSLSNVDLNYFTFISQYVTSDIHYRITYYGEGQKELIIEQASKFVKDKNVTFYDISKPDKDVFLN